MSATTQSPIELSFTQQLLAGVTDFRSELETQIIQLVTAGAVDEAQGDICDRLIAAWAELSRQQIRVNTAELLTVLQGRKNEAAAALQFAMEDLHAAEDAANSADELANDFQRARLKGTWAAL